MAIVAPYVSITNQMYHSFPNLELKTGIKPTEEQSFSNGRITSFHSIPRMLELENIDVLIIDEFHILSSYAGYTYGMLTIFWDTVEKLKAKHPHMKVVALTGTPQFMLLADFLDYNLLSIRPKQILSKPQEIYISRSWTSLLKSLDNYLYLYPSRKLGGQQARKYGGTYLDSSLKETDIFDSIIQGKMPSSKVFTSTVLSTGISITDFVPNVITNWLSLVDIIQMSARIRPGGHKLFVTQTTPWFARNGVPPVELNWTNSFEGNMKLLNDYTTWYSFSAHQASEDTLFSVIYQMLWQPESELPPVEYFN